MKPIRILDGPPQGLLDYLERFGTEANWQDFRDFRRGEAYLELVERLTNLQHGLCGYCEIDLRTNDRQVEHVVPQSDPVRGRTCALDVANLVACCSGGTLWYRFGPEGLDDRERFASPTRLNLSCGQAKGRWTDPMFVDPRTLPVLPLVMRVRFDGRIDADENGCAISRIPVDSVNRTIEVLGLNVSRLRRARERLWQAFNDNWNDHLGDS